MNIALIGYRGTGKSTVGRLLAQKSGWQFIDADILLEQRAGCTIRELFATQGEAFFRDLESQILSELVTQQQTVLALGGGVIMREQNRQLLKSITTVWLKASATVLHERIYTDSTTAERRPALTALGSFEEITTLLAKREPYYAECADYSVNTEGKSTEQIANEIVSLMNKD